MRNIKFIVNGIAADFYQASDLAPRFTYRSFNIEELGSAAGNYALNVQLPKTKHNNKNIFNFINVLENENTLYYQKRYNAYLEIDGDLIFNGTLTVNKITRDSYECTFIGENIDFAELLDSKSLRQIESFKRPLRTGVRSYLYNPVSTQNAPIGQNMPIDSVGLRDYWLNNTGSVSLDENDGLEFCLPLISYGNFNSAPNIDVTSPIGITGSDSASNNRYVFHATVSHGLDGLAIFPSCYLTTTVKNMFADLGYAVSGDFFLNEKYKNIFMPFVTADDAIWNRKTLSAVDIQYATIPSTDIRYRNNDTPPFTVANCRSFTRIKDAPVNNELVRYNEFNHVVNDTFPYTNYRRVHYIRPIWNPETDILDPATVVGPVQKLKNYAYNQTYFDKLKASSSNSPVVRSFICPAAGNYTATFTLNGGFGARNGRQAANENVWHQNTLKNQGFYLLLVKRNLNNASYLGDNGNGFIDIEDVNFPLTLDPAVISSVYFDTSTGVYNNLNTNPIELSITGTTDLQVGDTLEVVIAFVLRRYSTLLPAVDRQCFSIDDGYVPTWTVVNNDLETHLNPANFLPDISQAEFLRSILNTYNLFLFYDKNLNQIVINEYENYFLPTSTELDWSDKCSLEDDSVVISPVITNKQTEFKLTGDDNDILIIQDAIPTDITINNDSLYYDEIKTVQLGHSFTSMRPHYLVTSTAPGVTVNAYTQLDLPTMSTEEVNTATLLELYEGDTEYSYDFNRRLLKYKGIRVMNGTPQSLFIEDVIFNYLDEFYYPYAVQEDPTTYFNPRFQGDNNLLDGSWLRFLNQLQQSVSVELDVYLKASDINKLDLRKPIRIGFNQFQIDTIDEFNPMEEGLTRVKLLKK